MMNLLLYYLLYTVYFVVVTSHKIFFSCISTSSLPYGQRFFSRKLVKTLLCTQLKQTNLENRFHISTESPKSFDSTVFNILWIN